MSKDKSSFKEVPETVYPDKKICVTGLIKEYNDKGEIIVTSLAEITIE